MRNQFQARGQFKLGGVVVSRGHYPAIPAMWPNREVRRAVKQGKEHRLSGEWRQVLAVTKGLRAAIRAL